jgi:hypothetical protein
MSNNARQLALQYHNPAVSQHSKNTTKTGLISLELTVSQHAAKDTGISIPSLMKGGHSKKQRNLDVFDTA